MESSIDIRLEEFSAFEAALRAQKGHESELAQVLIISSFLDGQLKHIVAAYLNQKSNVKPLLEGPTAPLGTFYARMEMSYALGLLSDQEYETLTAIRSIRNPFAHKLSASFDDTKMTKFFDKLAWAVGADEAGSVDRSELLFIAAVRIGIGLTNRADHVALERRVSRQWPNHRIDADLETDIMDLIY